MQSAFPYASASFLSSRSLARTGAQLPYCFRLRCCLTVSVCAAALLFPFALLPYCFRLRCCLAASACGRARTHAILKQTKNNLRFLKSKKTGIRFEK
ncbi:hypothetical protein [Methanimicrococcus hacksteinii]|uniref:hypothetical protein n=1 Tax=Methanimicrococcus hacksteinii TaxID=3028293 RepID=UPI00298F055D|nr:hypothetical protein [Methanimicrococcus sp. At1]